MRTLLLITMTAAATACGLTKEDYETYCVAEADCDEPTPAPAPFSDSADEGFGDAYDAGDQTPVTGARLDIGAFTLSAEAIAGMERYLLSGQVTFEDPLEPTLPDGLDWLNCQLLVHGDFDGDPPDQGIPELVGMVLEIQADLQANGLEEYGSVLVAGLGWQALGGGADWFELVDGRLDIQFSAFDLLTKLGTAEEDVGDDLTVTLICSYREGEMVVQDTAGPIVLRDFMATLRQ